MGHAVRVGFMYPVESPLRVESRRTLVGGTTFPLVQGTTPDALPEPLGDAVHPAPEFGIQPEPTIRIENVASALERRIEGMNMKKRYAVPALAGLLTLGAAGVAEASQPSTSPTQTSASDDDGDSGKVGLWGLLGLAGLAGLAGLKRRNDPYDRTRYDNRDTSSTRTP
jgi:MYXO-CTERM domain-containing protein